MPINLKEHAVFIERLQMDMVPLSIAEKAASMALNLLALELERSLISDFLMLKDGCVVIN